MEMIEVKTAELIGPALDWAVAQAIGADQVEFCVVGSAAFIACIHRGTWERNWRPSTDWSQCGPLIEKYDIHIAAPARILTYFKWHAQTKNVHCEDLSLLVAVCRAVVSDRLGAVVSVPSRLV